MLLTSFLISSFFILFLIWYFPLTGIYLTMFFSFFIDWSTEELGLFPHYYTWIIEYVLILLSIRVLGFALLKKRIHLS